jgi:hypothetical protein
MALLFALSGTFLVPGCGKKDEGPSIEDICEDFAAKFVECNGPEYAAQQGLFQAQCEYSLAYYSSYYGEACGQAQEDYYACVSKLSCAQINDGQLGPCSVHESAIGEHCGDDQGSPANPAVTGVDVETGAPADSGTTG